MIYKKSMDRQEQARQWAENTRHAECKPPNHPNDDLNLYYDHRGKAAIA